MLACHHSLISIHVKKNAWAKSKVKTSFTSFCQKNLCHSPSIPTLDYLIHCSKFLLIFYVSFNFIVQLLICRLVFCITILYNCTLTRAKWVIRADKDRKIKFCCVQSDAAEPYLRACGLEWEDVLLCILFIEGLNVYSQGSTG